MTTGTYKVPIKFLAKHRKGTFKVEYLIKLSQYLGKLSKAIMRSLNKTFFSNASKILAEFNKEFNFEKFLIHVLPKI